MNLRASPKGRVKPPGGPSPDAARKSTARGSANPLEDVVSGGAGGAELADQFGLGGHVHPGSGWTTMYIRTDADADEAIEPSALSDLNVAGRG